LNISSANQPILSSLDVENYPQHVCLLLSSTVTLSLYLHLGLKITCSIMLMASLPVPPGSNTSEGMAL